MNSFMRRIQNDSNCGKEETNIIELIKYSNRKLLMASYRKEVIRLYKTLLHLGKDYPKGYEYFRSRLKTAFQQNRHIEDPAQIEMHLARGNYIIKELEALYSLKKYRTLKKRYYSEH